MCNSKSKDYEQIRYEKQRKKIMTALSAYSTYNKHNTSIELCGAACNAALIVSKNLVSEMAVRGSGCY